MAKGTVWERVASLVDLNDSRSKTNTKSTKDLARFKELLLALKREGDSAPVSGLMFVVYSVRLIEEQAAGGY